MKLKIFSDKSYLPQGMPHEIMLTPFWGKNQSKDYPWYDSYEYAETCSSFFEMTSLAEADVAIMPIPWVFIRGINWRDIRRNKVEPRQAQKSALKFAQEVERAGKPLAIFFIGDCSDEEIPIKNALVLRTSLYRSRRKPTDFALPAWGAEGAEEDLVKKHLNNQLPIRQKLGKPVVGFCGLAKPHTSATTMKSILYQSVMLLKTRKLCPPPHLGHTLRVQALDILSNSSLVDTNFIVRDSSIFLGESNLNMRKKARLEFMQNMVESDYILCCRGAGNYSIRIYETLCCGRIPVFIDTDCVLPYDFAVDWRKYCVWVDKNEISQIPEKIAEFHDRLSLQEFTDLQYECRKLWEKLLCPKGFFGNFHQHLLSNI